MIPDLFEANQGDVPIAPGAVVLCGLARPVEGPLVATGAGFVPDSQHPRLIVAKWTYTPAGGAHKMQSPASDVLLQRDQGSVRIAVPRMCAAPGQDTAPAGCTARAGLSQEGGEGVPGDVGAASAVTISLMRILRSVGVPVASITLLFGVVPRGRFTASAAAVARWTASGSGGPINSSYRATVLTFKPAVAMASRFDFPASGNFDPPFFPSMASLGQGGAAASTPP